MVWTGYDLVHIMDGIQPLRFSKIVETQNTKVVAGAPLLEKMGVPSYITLKSLFVSPGYIWEIHL